MIAANNEQKNTLDVAYQLFTGHSRIFDNINQVLLSRFPKFLRPATLQQIKPDIFSRNDVFGGSLHLVVVKSELRWFINPEKCSEWG